MSRRHSAEKREVLPDPKFGNIIITKFMNSVMYAGKKSVAEGIVYGALGMIETKTKQNPLGIFEQALENVMPTIEVRSRRVGGPTYQVPVEVRTARRQALGIRWIISAARERNDQTMTERLSAALLDASKNPGNAVQYPEDHHRMAGSHRAVSPCVWSRVWGGAVCVVGSNQGGEPQTEAVGRQGDNYKVPRIVLANKMDKVGADFFRCLDQIQYRLGAKAVGIQLPIGAENLFRGV